MNLFSEIKISDLKKNLLNSLYYFGGTAIQFFVAIATQPLYSKYLSLEDFALIGYFTAIQALLFSLFNMCLPYYYLARYWRAKEENSDAEMSFILNFLNTANAVVAVFAFFSVTLYFNVVNVVFPLLPFLLIILVQLFIEKYKTYYLIECRAKKQGAQYFMLNLLQITINTLFSVFFVVTLKAGAEGRMTGMLLGVVFSSSVAVFLLIKNKKYKFSLGFDKRKVRSALKYCVPLIIGAYAYYPLDNIDRLFLERVGDTSEYGYYSLGLTIAGFLGTFFVAMFQSFEPDLYKCIAEKKYKQYVMFGAAYGATIVIVSAFFICFSKPIVYFLTDGKYTHASDYADFFVIGIVIMQMGGFFEQLLTAFEATRLVMWRNIILGILTVAIYYFLIKTQSFRGAAVSRIIVAGLYFGVGSLVFLLFVRSKNRLKNVQLN